MSCLTIVFLLLKKFNVKSVQRYIKTCADKLFNPFLINDQIFTFDGILRNIIESDYPGYMHINTLFEFLSIRSILCKY